VARISVLREPRFDVPPEFARVVAAAFSQRRKTLRNSLRAILPDQAWEATDIDPGARPEVLAPHQFAALAALARPAAL
jgi:16S rRNA (adenine1518-N6/adenine1519-N6)-dimethyltransferase